MIARSLFPFVFVACSVAQAAAGVMGFEGFAPTGGEAFDVSPYSEAGFTLTFADTGSAILSATSGAGGNSNGTDIFVWDNANPSGARVVIEESGGNPFALLSLDSSQAFTLDPDPGSLEVTAFFAGGGSTTQTFGITLNVWQTFSPTGFANLSRVEIHAPGTDLALDNIQLVAGSASVPEPSALAVFALGSPESLARGLDHSDEAWALSRKSVEPKKGSDPNSAKHPLGRSGC